MPLDLERVHQVLAVVGLGGGGHLGGGDGRDSHSGREALTPTQARGRGVSTTVDDCLTKLCGVLSVTFHGQRDLAYVLNLRSTHGLG